MEAILLFAIVLALAWVNGANDNFKGVATLYGSGTLSFRRAQVLAASTTAAGALASAWLAGRLAHAFSGKGLVSPELIGDPAFLMSVGGAAALTVLLATKVGMPTSTTHALTGALLGVSLVEHGGTGQMNALWNGFLLPLLFSPPLAMALAAGVEFARRGSRADGGGAGLLESECLCVGPQRQLAPAFATSRSFSCGPPLPGPGISLGTKAACALRFDARALRLAPASWTDRLHALSACAVCFARGLNDTPKIAALLLAGGGASSGSKLAGVACAMVLGGMLQGRKVAETMSRRITPMSTTQGLSANLVTASLVLGASHLGLPVSTTHVSVGALFGLGAASGAARWRTIQQILATWTTTFPFALASGSLLWLATGHWSAAR